MLSLEPEAQSQSVSGNMTRFQAPIKNAATFCLLSKNPPSFQNTKQTPDLLVEDIKAEKQQLCSAYYLICPSSE